jgi:hypothetical protein
VCARVGIGSAAPEGTSIVTVMRNTDEDYNETGIFINHENINIVAGPTARVWLCRYDLFLL